MDFIMTRATEPKSQLNKDRLNLFLTSSPLPECSSRIFFLIGTHPMQGSTVTTRHGVTRKKSTKRLKHTGNWFEKNLQFKGAS